MAKLRYLTAGESHGQALVGILEGMPAGLEISEEELRQDLKRRQMGHGRGGRMKIEKDAARFLSGVRFGKTLGSPIALLLENKDWANWEERMAVAGPPSEHAKKVTVPRPGHADQAGAVKYAHSDLRNVLERASARETAMRVALGAIARKFLAAFDIQVASHVIQIYNVRSSVSATNVGSKSDLKLNLSAINQQADNSPVRCLDLQAEKNMIASIDKAKEDGNTVGGVFEVVAFGLPVGLGSYVHWDRKLDGRVAEAMMSIPAMKGVEIGLGFQAAARLGSEVHDEIYFDDSGTIARGSNHAGGLEGGVTNGMPLVARVAMKPISTLLKPLNSVNLETGEETPAHIERSDVCAVPAASIVGEAVMRLVLAEVFLEKFGGDSMSELHRVYQLWRDHAGT